MEKNRNIWEIDELDFLGFSYWLDWEDDRVIGVKDNK